MEYKPLHKNVNELLAEELTEGPYSKESKDPLESSTERSFKRLLEKAMQSVEESDDKNKSTEYNNNLSELDKAVVVPVTGDTTRKSSAGVIRGTINFMKEFEEYDSRQEYKEKMEASKHATNSIIKLQPMQVETRNLEAQESTGCTQSFLCGIDGGFIRSKCSII